MHHYSGFLVPFVLFLLAFKLNILGSYAVPGKKKKKKNRNFISFNRGTELHHVLVQDLEIVIGVVKLLHTGARRCSVRG